VHLFCLRYTIILNIATKNTTQQHDRCEGTTWRSRYNEELYRLYDETDLVATITITRLRWAGHIVRMQDNLPCKKITLDKQEGRRRVGRPNLRWMDEVIRDAERLGVRN